MDFDELRKSWQAQPVHNINPEPGKAGSDNSDLLQKLKALALKRRKRTGWMIATLCATIIFLAYVVYASGLRQMTSYVGFGLLFLAMTGYMLLFYANKLDIREFDSSRPTRIFLEKIMHWFRFRRILMRWAFPIYAALLLAGLSLMYVEILSRASITFRLTAYGIVYAYIIMITIWGTRREKRRFQKEAAPLMEKVQELLKAYEE